MHHVARVCVLCVCALSGVFWLGSRREATLPDLSRVEQSSPVNCYDNWPLTWAIVNSSANGHVLCQLENAERFSRRSTVALIQSGTSAKLHDLRDAIVDTRRHRGILPLATIGAKRERHGGTTRHHFVVSNALGLVLASLARQWNAIES